MLKLSGVGKSYGGPRGRLVLSGVDFELAAGDYVAIMGESGVGKSTLLNLIAGLDRSDRGSIVLDGVDIGTLDDDARTRLRRERIGFVFQAFHLLPHLTLAQNVALPLALLGAGRADTATRVAEMLDAVGLGARGASFPREISGGEAQRVAIARALVHRPRLLLADEPTGNLDPDNAAQVSRLLRECVKAHGCAGVLVTHSQVAAATTDHRYLLAANGLRLQAGAA